MFEAREISDRKMWDEFVFNFCEDGFIQSWEWGEAKREIGRDVFRVGVFQKKELVLVALIVKEIVWGNFSMLYIARGPILKTKLEIQKYTSIWKVFLRYVDELAKQQKVVFSKMEPWKNFLKKGNNGECSRGCCCELGFRSSSWTLQPQRTLLLDLRKSEEEILAKMKAKTRYNIKLSHKKKVKVEETLDVERFWRLAEMTAKRDRFSIHDKAYYQALIRNGLKLLVASVQGEDLAAIIVGFSKKRGIYFHGASSDRRRELMATYLVQWKAILTARKKGCDFYDFWGVAPLKEKEGRWELSNRTHSWNGITKFKLGFVPDKKAGIYEEYPGAWDRIYRKFWYRNLMLARKIKNLC
jgi:lipid II:glycine glycyltransferase (peptidoglycan interpeptide bridge formation enzyme)